MAHIATVVEIIPVTKGKSTDEADVVILKLDGRQYVWECARGEYSLGQDVSVELPTSGEHNITPA